MKEGVLPEGSASQEMRRGDRNALLAIIWILGAIVRLSPLLVFPGVNERPFGMGGLYYLFSREILTHNFALPSQIPYYTLQGLPYAYPPLAFYVEALVLRLLPVSSFLVVNVLPALFSILTVGAFFLLARTWWGKDRKALLSTAIYALLPAAFLEHLPGEGLVEGLGTLVFIGGLFWFLRLGRTHGWREKIFLGVFVALNILASPGGAYGLAVSIAILWLLRVGGRRVAFWKLLVAALLGLLLSAPYWLAVALRHGPTIFFRTFLQQHAHLGVLILAKMGFLVEQQLPLSPWGILAMIGLAASLACRQFALPLWCVLVYLIPREFTYLMAVPLALLAAYGLQDVVLPGMARQEERVERSNRGAVLATGVVLFVLFSWGLVRASAWAVALPGEKDLVSVDELTAMLWVREHTPPSATFLVIGDEIEWFPVITERTTLNVIWGSEWAETDTVFRLDAELVSDSSADEYLATAAAYGLAPDYIYLSRTAVPECLVQAALGHRKLDLAWEGDGAVIFHVLDR
jgi:hypothetical protein